MFRISTSPADIHAKHVYSAGQARRVRENRTASRNNAKQAQNGPAFTDQSDGGADWSYIMLYKDEESIADKIIAKVSKGKALIDFVDEQDVRHRLFGIDDKKDVGAIVKMMGGKSCVIADGHHRYETALNYYKETGNPAAAHLMMAFANTENEGLVVLATHRLVNNLENFDAEKFIGSLNKDFQITSYNFDSSKTKSAAKQKMLSQMKAEYDKDKIAFGIYTGHDGFYVAVLKDKGVMDKLAPDKSPAWRSLDLAVLHKTDFRQGAGTG